MRICHVIISWIGFKYNIVQSSLYYHVINPNTFHVRIGWIRIPRDEGSNSFAKWIAWKWKVAVVEVDVIFIPYYGNNHWNFFILSDEYFLYYDFLRDTKLYDEIYIQIYLTKIWVVWKGFGRGLVAWKIVPTQKFG